MTPMEDLDSRLANWRAWLRNLPRTGHCGSIESLYRSPQHWHPAGPRPRESRAADAWDLSLAAATLPIVLHVCLRLKYVIQFPDQVVASILREDRLRPRCKAIDVPAIDWEARTELLAALAQPLAVRRSMAVDKARAMLTMGVA